MFSQPRETKSSSSVGSSEIDQEVFEHFDTMIEKELQSVDPEDREQRYVAHSIAFDKV